MVENGFWDRLGAAATRAWNGITNGVGSAVEGMSTYAQNATVGNVGGGLLGVGAAFLAGNIFGGGMFGWLITLLLAPMFLVIGSRQGPIIDNWLGSTNNTRSASVEGSTPALVQSASHHHDTTLALDPTLPNLRARQVGRG